MSLFGQLLEKLGIKKPEQAAPAHEAPKAVAQAPKPVPKPAPGAVADVQEAKQPDPSTKPSSAPAAPPVTPMAMVDVVSKLEKMAAGTGLNWKVSIVDLLKVLGLDSSLQARKELAQELGCPPETMKDNVAMNIWLHKAVLEQIAKNGGNIPKELLD